jgi:hypothetical protein
MDEALTSKKNFTNKLFLDFVSNPSQNFLAENFTLPQGEGDDTESVASIFCKIQVCKSKGES